MGVPGFPGMDGVPVSVGLGSPLEFTLDSISHNFTFLTSSPISDVFSPRPPTTPVDPATLLRKEVK